MTTFQSSHNTTVTVTVNHDHDHDHDHDHARFVVDQHQNKSTSHRGTASGFSADDTMPL
jgi:hypothetical protein